MNPNDSSYLPILPLFIISLGHREGRNRNNKEKMLFSLTKASTIFKVSSQKIQIERWPILTVFGKYLLILLRLIWGEMSGSRTSWIVRDQTKSSWFAEISDFDPGSTFNKWIGGSELLSLE